MKEKFVSPNVSERFQTTLWKGTAENILGLVEPWVRIKSGFKDGDKVRVTVELIKRQSKEKAPK